MLVITIGSGLIGYNIGNNSSNTTDYTENNYYLYRNYPIEVDTTYDTVYVQDWKADSTLIDILHYCDSVNASYFDND